MIYRGPEEQILKKESINERSNKIEIIKSGVLNKLKEQGIPIDSDLRIDPNNEIFKEAIEENKINLKADNEKVEEIEKKFEKKEGIPAGEALEIFKTYLFNKYLSNKLICVRTSKYDDYKNGVDNLLINKENGEIICALDEVADISSGRFKKKFKEVKSKNIIGGAIVRYAVTYRENKVIPAINVRGAPLVLFALSEGVLMEAIDRLDSNNIEDPKYYELNILKHFKIIVESTISILESEKRLLEESIKKPEEMQPLNDRIEKLKKLTEILETLKIYDSISG